MVAFVDILAPTITLYVFYMLTLLLSTLSLTGDLRWLLYTNRYNLTGSLWTCTLPPPGPTPLWHISSNTLALSYFDSWILWQIICVPGTTTEKGNRLFSWGWAAGSSSLLLGQLSKFTSDGVWESAYDMICLHRLDTTPYLQVWSPLHFLWPCQTLANAI